jgi:hypothetical protein
LGLAGNPVISGRESSDFLRLYVCSIGLSLEPVGSCAVVRFLPEVDMAEPTYEEMKARLAELEKQVSTRRTGSLDFRVSEKGGVSVYGLGRFPVTLYFEQWTRLLDQADQLRAFLEENKSKLKLKEPK